MHKLVISHLDLAGKEILVEFSHFEKFPIFGDSNCRELDFF